MRLLFPKDIQELAEEICSMANPQSEEEAQEFNCRRKQDLEEITRLMKIDLGIGSN